MRSYSALVVALLGALSLTLVSAQLERCHTTILTPQHFLNLSQVQQGFLAVFLNLYIILWAFYSSLAAYGIP